MVILLKRLWLLPLDWNGPRQVTAFATENDTLNGVSMLLGTLLTNKAPIFSDVRTY